MVDKTVGVHAVGGGGGNGQKERKKERKLKTTNYIFNTHQASNRRLLGCSTGGCLTILIEQKLFDDLKKWDVQLRLCLTENCQT